MAYSLGIDVGTTFTAAAIFRDGRAETVALGDHANAIPSVFFARDDGTLLIGDTAARRAGQDPTRTINEVKRRFGDPVPILRGGRAWRPEQLTAELIRMVVAAVSTREAEPPEHVTLTYPATWGDVRRDLMEGAARQAGLSDVGLLTEPVAAAIYYASLQRVATGATVAVYDLGGGTFDSAVLRKTADGFVILGKPQGDERLGGIDLDQLLIQHCADVLGQAWNSVTSDNSVLAQLRTDIVSAKESLSYDLDAIVTVVTPNGVHHVRVTRAEFAHLIHDSLLRTVSTFERALASAAVPAEDLQSVLLVGGCSRIPLVVELLSGSVPAVTAVDAHPKFAICLGAAVAAGAHLAREDYSRPSVTSTYRPDTPELHEPTRDISVDLVASGLTGVSDVPLQPAVDLSQPDPYPARQDPLVIELNTTGDGSRRSWLVALIMVLSVIALIVTLAVLTR